MARTAQTGQAAPEQVAAARQERDEAVRGAESRAAGAESRTEQAESRTMPVILPPCLRSWRLTITCMSAMTDCNEQPVINLLQSAHNAD
jgi:hypothetical protein